MKKVILTVDYELFFGTKSGSVSECMIEPTERLLNLLENYKSKMTLFWDILHFYKLLELENRFPELKKERISIESQIKKIIRMGHDVQLHIHPHWLDAKYEGGKWNFTYNRFRIHELSEEKKPLDINTILGCITKSVKLMEHIIRQEDPNYQVSVFRAGGYLKDPFPRLKAALLENGIRIDSSVSLGLYSNNGNLSYDYRQYNSNKEFAQKIVFHEEGIEEIPIASIKIPIIRHIYYKSLRKFKYRDLYKHKRGIGIRNKCGNEKILRKISKVFFNRVEQFTFDNNFPEKISYLIDSVPEYSTLIVHSKFLNESIFNSIDNKLLRKEIKFISIKDFID